MINSLDEKLKHDILEWHSTISLIDQGSFDRASFSWVPFTFDSVCVFDLLALIIFTDWSEMLRLDILLSTWITMIRAG